tara:strand:+ start:348 stop:881 length:534 start_codon:yes stop_codon:yes gene_type:complete
MPILVKTKTTKLKSATKPKIDEDLSVEEIKASDGKTYKFLGSQWAELLPSGKTGLFAKKKIGRELDKITGRKRENIAEKRKKRAKKEVDPSSEDLSDEKLLPKIYEPKQGLGFFGYIFLILIIGFSLVGVLKTFENDLVTNFPKMESVFDTLNIQLEFFSETVKNMIVIINDLIVSY